MMRPARRAGFVAWVWLLIVLMVVSIFVAFRVLNRRLVDTRECRARLQRIYAALELYEFNEGRLPELAFYPTGPLTSAESLVTALSRYGLRPSDCVCPASGHAIRESGLSYLWNPNLNQHALGASAQPVWMLVEVEAINPQLAPPHLSGYHILYSDGTVKSAKAIPHDIPVHHK